MEGISKEAALDVLNGNKSLIIAFTWSSTPQGQKFWEEQHEDGELSEEGRAILESIAYGEPVAVAGSNGNQHGKITIRAGKFYRTRDGRKVGPMKPWTMGDGTYQWESDGYLWKDDGENYDKDSVHTIVAEWTDELEDAGDSSNDTIDDWYYGKASKTTGFTVPLEAPEFGCAESKFKVGDRVIATDNNPNGYEGRIKTADDFSPEYLVEFDGWHNGHGDNNNEWWMTGDELRLVAEATSGKDNEPDAKLLVTISADTSALDAEIDSVLKKLKKLKKRARKLGIDLEYSQLRDAA